MVLFNKLSCGRGETSVMLKELRRYISILASTTLAVGCQQHQSSTVVSRTASPASNSCVSQSEQVGVLGVQTGMTRDQAIAAITCRFPDVAAPERNAALDPSLSPDWFVIPLTPDRAPRDITLFYAGPRGNGQVIAIETTYQSDGTHQVTTSALIAQTEQKAGKLHNEHWSDGPLGSGLQVLTNLVSGNEGDLDAARRACKDALRDGPMHPLEGPRPKGFGPNDTPPAIVDRCGKAAFLTYSGTPIVERFKLLYVDYPLLRTLYTEDALRVTSGLKRNAERAVDRARRNTAPIF